MSSHKLHHTVPPPGKRLTSGFGMFKKPINTIRNKAFSRASRHASGSSDAASTNAGHTRQSLSVKSVGQGSMKADKQKNKMVKSQTMSFLPVPSKVSSDAF